MEKVKMINKETRIKIFAEYIRCVATNGKEEKEINITNKAENLASNKGAVMHGAYNVLFLGTEYSVLIPKDFYPNKIDVADTCDFCVIIRNKDGFSYENVTVNDIRNSLKNNDYPKQTDLLNAVRRWNEFDFLKENNIYDTCLRCKGKGRVASEYPNFCGECQNKYPFKYSNSIHFNRCVLHYA